ncbi:hypothetical protein C8R44DRAFT_236443 [Mycena epipterygia]|nr:hypothetical protein C8R44DRAFT_236443 [Mycena epipterygia]
MVPLAQELINEIIDQLDASKGKDDLRACSLVASMFREPSQRRLFRSLSLGGSSSLKAKPVEELARVFSKSPHLPSYVRNLTMFLGSEPSVIDALASIIRRFIRVERLLISGDSTWYSHASSVGRLALFSLLSLPFLRSLALNCTGVPRCLIIHALSTYEEVVLNPFDLLGGEEEFFFVEDGIEWKSHNATPTLERLALDYYPSHSSTLHSIIIGGDIGKILEKLQFLNIKIASRWSLGAFEIALKCHSTT